MRFLFLLYLLIAILICSKAVHALEALVPRVDDVRTSLQTGKIEVTFGYYNPNPLTLEINYGASNYMHPAPRYRFQPLRFDPGNVDRAFSTLIENDEWIEWRLFYQSSTILPDPDPTNPQSAYADASMSTAHFVETDSTFTWGSSAMAVAHLEVGTWETGAVFNMVGGDFASASTEIGAGGAIYVDGGSLNTTQAVTNAGIVQMTGGQWQIGSMINSAEGDIALGGGDLTGSTWENKGTLTGHGGNLEVTHLTNSGFLEWNAGRLVVMDELTNSGAMTLSGGTLAVKDFETAAASSFVWNSGTLQVMAGDLDTNAPVLLGSNPNLRPGQALHLLGGVLKVGSGQYVNISPDAELKSQGGTNKGDIYISAGSFITENGRFRNESSGVINAINSTLRFGGGLDNYGVMNLIGSLIEGEIHSLAGSSINVASGVTFADFFRGAATFTGGGLVTFQGGYAPGDSPAFVQHAGSVAFGSSNNLMMEIGGLGRGSEYDALNVQGSLMFGGLLTVSFVDEFLASEGDVFDLFDWLSGAGQFTEYYLPELSAGLAWDTSSLYQTGELRVTAVPEARTVSLLLLAASAWIMRRRKC